MHFNNENHRYWILSALIFLVLIFFLYPHAIFKDFSLEITRSNAIEIAGDFLKKNNIDVRNFESEAFINDARVENRYLLKKLGAEKFRNVLESAGWMTRGWRVMYHQNLSRELPQTIYTVQVSHSGNIVGFNRDIPDTAYVPSITKSEADSLIYSFISSHFSGSKKRIDIASFQLVESKQENFANRTDYKYRWERKIPKIDGKMVINASIQGNRPGSFWYSYSAPESESGIVDAGQALFSTASVIFVFLLMQLAFYLFLKKYHQGEVWISVGRNLFLLYLALSIIMLVNIWPNIGMGVNVGNLSFLNTKIIVVLINGFIIQFLLALLLFASWGVGESYARALAPSKLNGIDSFIKGHIFSQASGAALLKGLTLGTGLALIYLVSTILLNKPDSILFIYPFGNFEQFGGYMPAVSVIFDGLATALLSSIVVTFFTINIVYNRWKNKRLTIAVTGFVTMLVSVIVETPPSVNNLLVNLFVIFIFGCFLAYIYFAFDLLTLASLNFHAYLITRGYLLYAGNNSFFELNFLLVVIAFIATPLIYIISRIRKENFVLENYGLPSHVKRISERERLRKEMEIAAKVQLSLLPKEEPKIPGYEIASISIPAVEAGGDYFDYVKLGQDKIGIAIGDVSGKGVGAAIYMTLTKGILQAHAEENVSPKEVLGKVNHLLYKTIEKNSFVSMFYAILDIKNHTMLYSRAGHNPAIVCSRENGGTKMLLSKGMALGLEEGSIFRSNLTEETIELKQGDIFVLYTDGFTEAMNEKQEEFGEKRLTEIVQLGRDKNPREVMNLILKEVKKFVDNYPQHDDMTMVIIKRM